MKLTLQFPTSQTIVRFLSRYCLLLLIALAPAAPSLANTSAEPSLSGKPDGLAIDASKNAVKALLGVSTALNMTTTSLESMAEKLDFEPLAAISYVTNEISFLPYAGSMRGEIGSMVTGSASALDQALLLGGLLDLMGVDVVLAHGELGSVDTERLMRQAVNVKAPDSAIDTAKIDQLGVPKSAVRESEEANTLSTADVNSRLEKIAATLRRSLQPQSSDPLAELKADVSKHYVWVRYRDLPTDPWLDVHPAFAIATAPSPRLKSFSPAEIPEGRGHTFGFKLMLEVTESGRVKETVLASFAPEQISELAAQQIDITLIPSGMDPTNVSIGSDAAYFFPVINGQTPTGAKAFSPRGRVVSADIVTSGKSGGAAASLFGDLNAKLGSTSPKGLASQPHVTGLWIEAIYQSPLGIQMRRRPLIDLSSSKPGDLVSATDAMLRMVIDFNIGETNSARKMEYQANAMVGKMQRLPYVAAAASGAMTIADYTNEPALIGVGNKDAWMAMAMLQELYLPARYQDQVVLPLTALVSTMTESTLAAEGETAATMRQALDLMFTGTLILNNDADTLQADRDAVMRLGIYRTLSETLMMTDSIDDSPLTNDSGKLTAVNTEAALASFIEQNSISRKTSIRLTEDLKSAGTVLISEASDRDDLRWWKIDQATGEALGMGVLGGQAASYSFFVTLAESNAISVAFFVVGVWSCAIDSANDAAKLDYNANVANFKTCLAVNVAGYVIGGHITALKTARANLVTKIKTGFFVDVVSMAVGGKVNSGLKSAR